IWPAKNATARIAAAIASAAKPDRSQAWPKSASASHKSPWFTVPLAQLAPDVLAKFLQHTRDGGLDLRWRRTVLQLLTEGIEQQLSFPRLTCRDRRGDFIPVGFGFIELGLSLSRIARSISGVNRAQRRRYLIE